MIWNHSPPGFFIERAGDTYIIKYSKDYRAHQLKHDPDISLKVGSGSLDSYADIQEDDLKFTASKADLLKTLQERNIKLTKKQLDFLDTLDQEKQNLELKGGYASGAKEKITKPVKSFVFRALRVFAEATYPLPNPAITTEETEQDPFLGELIDTLEIFSKINPEELLGRRIDNFIDLERDPSVKGSATYLDQEIPGNPSYLNFFISFYLKNIKEEKDAALFTSKASRDALKRLQAIVQDKTQFSWLFGIEMGTFGQLHDLSAHYTCLSFSQTTQGLFRFFDCLLKDAGLNKIPPFNAPSHRAGHGYDFSELKLMLDCIMHSKVKELQAQFLFAMPDLDSAKHALKAGYAFVHRAMKIDNSGSNVHFVMRDEFKNMTYQNVTNSLLSFREKSDNPSGDLKAWYLRFAACCIASDYVTQAIQKWEEVTGEKLSEECFYAGDTYYDPNPDHFWNGAPEEGAKRRKTKRILKNGGWETLRDFALSLPPVLAVAPDKDAMLSDAFANEKLEASIINKKLYWKDHIDELLLKVSLPSDLQAAIRQSIDLVNGFAKKYIAFSPEELEKALKNIRTIESLEERIALLRELHYRMTYAHSEENPRQGEWMRLEQLVSILIAMKTHGLLQIDTSEGKTLILQMISILKALNGQKINVITHNETLALDAGSKIKKIAHYVGLKTAIKTTLQSDPSALQDSAEDIIQADILYTDISSAVISDLLVQCKEGKAHAPMPGDRKADVAIVDEVDNVVIDIQLNTTMQISEENKEATPEFEAFLFILNDVVRNKISQEIELTFEAQRDLIREALKENAFYQAQCQTDADLDEFIRAAVSAMGLKKDEDYIVEQDTFDPDRRAVHIVHKETTGRVDKISQWGHHIHQCIAAWEKAEEQKQAVKSDVPSIKIPGMTHILRKGEVASYLQARYKERMGVSGTLGDEGIRHEIEMTLQGQAENAHEITTVVMPRAKRELDEGANWPLRMPEASSPEAQPEATPETAYHRTYWFPPVMTPSKEAHFEKLVEAMQNIQASGQSCILFLNTIDECNELLAYLKNEEPGHALEDQDHIDQENHPRCVIEKVQILDDTRDTTGSTSAFRPPESVIIKRANVAGMITLTTAAGSRGTDFDSVDVGILAKPGLGRVTIQKAGRVGRNGELGLIYEIYNEQDFDPALLAQQYETLKEQSLQSKAKAMPTDDPKQYTLFARLFHRERYPLTGPKRPRLPSQHRLWAAKPHEDRGEEKMRQGIVSKRQERKH